MKRSLSGLLAMAVLALGSAEGHKSHKHTPFKFVALGDMPYKVPDDYARFEALIETINQRKPAFSIHVGDIKGGSTPCSDEAFQKIKDQFGMFKAPLIYTPGDNEWTDCHRTKAGKFDPLERLAKVREIFFTEGKSLGQTLFRLKSQKGLVENSQWRKEGVVFATAHVVGSNNGLERNQKSIAEYFERNTKNIEWIKEAFDLAKSQNAPAVVLAFHADAWKNAPLVPTDRGLRDTVNIIAKESKDYGRPVLLIHGDSHVLIIDRPLLEDGAITHPGQMGKTLKNVTRLEVMGSSDVGAVEVMVDPEDPAVFSFKPLYTSRQPTKK